MISIFGEFNENLERFYTNYVSSTAPQPYAASKTAGYVHTLNAGNAILITDDFIPYLITTDLVQKHALKTGDYVDCQATFSAFHERDLIIMVDNVRHVNYDEIPVVKATRHFTIDGRPINFGSTTLVQIDQQTDIYQRAEQIFTNVPANAKKMVLSFDGRRENFNPEYLLHVTKPGYSSRDKLTQCLLCFFQAKEMVATGEDVVLVIDSLDKMFNVFNNCMQKVGVIDPNFISTNAVTDLESILRSSTCLQNQGTFTIVGLHHQRNTAPQQYITERFYQLFDNFI